MTAGISQRLSESIPGVWRARKTEVRRPSRRRRAKGSIEGEGSDALRMSAGTGYEVWVECVGVWGGGRCQSL